MVLRVDKSENCARLNIFNEYGQIPHMNIMIAGGIGSGKTVATAALAEELHNNGALVIIATNKPRGELDFGYCAFEPTTKYHVDTLRNQNRIKSKKKVKFYHPNSSNFLKKSVGNPLYRHLPPINWYKFPLRKTEEIDFSFIMESPARSESVKILMSALKKVKPNQTLNHLIYNANEILEKMSTSKKEATKPDFDNFGVPEGSGTKIKNIVDSFSFLKEDNVFGCDGNESLFDAKKILTDQEHYHIFFREFVKHKKTKYLDYMKITRELLNNLHVCKHPVVLIIEEARVWFPERPSETYIEIASGQVRDDLSTIRDAGEHGCSVLLNSQCIFDVHSGVRDSVTEELWGRLPTVEIDRITKSLGMNREMRNIMAKLTVGHFVKKGELKIKEWTALLPTHAFGEEGHSFLKLWKEQYETVNYVDFFKDEKKREKEKQKEFESVVKEKYRVKRKEKVKEESKKVKKKEKVGELDKEKDKVKEQKDKSKEERMKMCHKLYFGECNKNALKVVRKLKEFDISISDKVAKSYALRFQERIETEEALPKLNKTFSE